MLHRRKSEQRGHTHRGWLDSWHSFSFANYVDPRYSQFSTLRVINEDFIDEGRGFPTHAHQDMEILTYVRQGRVTHKDSMGNATDVRAGEFQIMSAGTGIQHSEYNPSSDELLHLFQIWITPQKKGLPPRYDQRRFEPQSGPQLILSPDAHDGSLQVFQDMQLWRWSLKSGEQTTYTLLANRRLWLQLISGGLTVNGEPLENSDGLALWDENLLHISADSDSEFLLFDLP